MTNLREIAEKHKDKLKGIKVVAFDVDGILTNGQVYWSGNEVGFNRFTHTHDGYMMKVLMKAGLLVGVITGGDSLGIKKRFADDLKLSFVYSGNEDKRVAFTKLMDRGYKAHEILYMGDEFFDIPLLRRSGFSATVSEAPDEVKESVDYVASKPGGFGAAREVMDILRYAQGIVPEVPDFE